MSAPENLYLSVSNLEPDENGNYPLTADPTYEDDIEYTRASSNPAEGERVRDLVKAAEEFKKEAVVLSEEYLETFSHWPDDATVQGWDKARWKRAIKAEKRLQAALAAMEGKR